MIFMRQFVTPGEELPKEVRRGEYVMFSNSKAYSNILGFYDTDKETVVPLEGVWSPRVGDTIIGVVEKPTRPGIYNVVLSDFASGLIVVGKFDSGPEFEANDLIEAVVSSTERKKLAILENPRKLASGITITVKPVRIPRIIGRNETMIGQISRFTGTHIVIGRNGIIWLEGGDIKLAIKAIRTVESESGTSGLTERIKHMLENELERSGN